MNEEEKKKKLISKIVELQAQMLEKELCQYFGNDSDLEIIEKLYIQDGVKKNEDKIIFAQMVKHLRNQKGWTMQELADKTGNTKSAISRWESGENTPKLESIETIAKVLEVSPKELIFGK